MFIFIGYDNEYQSKSKGSILTRKNNTLPIWGNERTMNLNTLILTNIQSSHYFKGNQVPIRIIIYKFTKCKERLIAYIIITVLVNLYELKTYHEVIDEIYYKVQHLEPWEKGSRKTSGQTGMCGGVSNIRFYIKDL